MPEPAAYGSVQPTFARDAPRTISSYDLLKLQRFCQFALLDRHCRP